MADVYTQAGEELVVDILDGTVGVPATWYGHWGTGAGTHDKASTDVFTPGSESRASCTMSQPAADKTRWVFTLTADAGKTITNGGVFSASTGGTLIVAGDHTGIPLSAGDKIEYTVELEQT